MHFCNQTIGFAGLKKALFTKYCLDCNWMKMMMIMMMIGLITVTTITSSSNMISHSLSLEIKYLERLPKKSFLSVLVFTKRGHNVFSSKFQQFANHHSSINSISCYPRGMIVILTQMASDTRKSS
jgi:hypothetical protein